MNRRGLLKLLLFSPVAAVLSLRGKAKSEPTTWANVVESTGKRYKHDQLSAADKQRLMLRLLEKKGRITFRSNGQSVAWRIK